MRNKLGTERRNLEYFEHQGLWKSLKRSAKQHGFNGTFGTIYYAIVKNVDWILHIFAQKLPFTGIRIKLHKFRGVNIGKNVFIGYNCTLDEVFPDFITIKDYCGLNGSVTLLTHTTPGIEFKSLFESYVSPIIINSHSWIGINSTIMPGVTIGPFSVVAAGSVVFEDVPPYTVVRGNPAKVVAKLPNRIINKNINKMGLKRWVQES